LSILKRKIIALFQMKSNFLIHTPTHKQTYVDKYSKNTNTHIVTI